MQKLMGMLGICVCVGIAPLATAADGIGGIAGGALSGAGGAGAGGVTTGGAAAAAAASRLRVPGRGPGGDARQVGSNFGPAQAGVSGGAGASLSGPGIGVSAAASANARADVRGGVPAGGLLGQPGSKQAAGARDGSQGSIQAGAETQQQRLLLKADMMLTRRLAEVDRLRDTALAAGDVTLLKRADHLEQQARLEHTHHVGHLTALQAAGDRGVEGQLAGQSQFAGEVAGQGQLAIQSAGQIAAQASGPGQLAAQAAGQTAAQVAGETSGQSQLVGQAAMAFATRPYTDPATGLTTWFDAQSGLWMQASAGSQAALNPTARTAQRQVQGQAQSQAAVSGLIEGPPANANAAANVNANATINAGIGPAVPANSSNTPASQTQE